MGGTYSGEKPKTLNKAIKKVKAKVEKGEGC
jgi:hypothetical protein